MNRHDIETAKSVYVKEDSTRCFMCGSSHIEGGAFEVDGKHAKQEMSCGDCEHEWEDLYTLTGVED